MSGKVAQRAVGVLVFPRDREKGERIVQSLAENYRPSLIFWEEERLEMVLSKFDLLVAVMAVGIVVRFLCGHLKDKWTDTPVVAVDSSLKCAVPVVGGHHGANDLALCLGDALGLFPAITTATDASGRPCLEGVAAKLGAEIVDKDSSKAVNIAFLREDVPVMRLKGPKIVVVDDDVAVLKIKGLVVGLGARRGVSYVEVLEAIDAALAEAGRRREDIGILATAWLKRDEIGMTEAARCLGKEMLYLSEEALNAQVPTTPSRAADIGLAGVAEPAVLALATKLILPKKAYGRVTVAIGA
ncbi:MAG: cobalamin biosynthesis protein CbiG [Methanosaeta sp. PtaB.Bin018]|jgi:cobalt-precorrin 5A hydrolase|nr:cobalt-precorrin 5A hydrolase [Methanothrix sp.]OPX75819.1 MAG: cobalamin biosynthesis protein CbiG [Methanosaeta sp. PtaB.Bin018]OPY47959.1 MAG: cobalamin biosynthesis protein CbiG [Methanosaeta sp. PtaU1.Bin016]